MVLKDGRVIPKECFVATFSRSGGAGGQHVNKTESRVDLAKVARILDAALERGAQMPLVMDVQGVTAFAEAFVLLTGRSDRQVRAIANSPRETNLVDIENIYTAAMSY